MSWKNQKHNLYKPLILLINIADYPRNQNDFWTPKILFSSELHQVKYL